MGRWLGHQTHNRDGAEYHSEGRRLLYLHESPERSNVDRDRAQWGVASAIPSICRYKKWRAFHGANDAVHQGPGRSDDDSRSKQGGGSWWLVSAPRAAPAPRKPSGKTSSPS